MKSSFENDLDGAVYAPHEGSPAWLSRVRLSALTASSAISGCWILVWALHHGSLSAGYPLTPICALACTAALVMQGRRNQKPATRLAIFALACLAIVAIIGDLPGAAGRLPIFPGTPLAPLAGTEIAAKCGYLLIALLLMATDAELGIRSVAADVLVLLLMVDSLAVAGTLMFSALHVYGPEFGRGPARPEDGLIVVLAIAAVCQRTDKGLLRILVRGGMAGQFGRTLLPVLVFLPFLREATRARLLLTWKVPEASVAAFLAAIAAGLSVLLLIFVCGKFAAMESEIQALSLRDELTGLLNLRGFRILADQALRIARRSNRPFCVMFIDLDRLKQINDELGHETGSAFLVSAADLLRSRFRESDVVARIGGDEFAVAAQLSEEELAGIVAQLRDSSGHRQTPDFPLSLSIGYATTSDPHNANVESLLRAADRAMYDEKWVRRRETQPRQRASYGRRVSRSETETRKF